MRVRPALWFRLQKPKSRAAREAKDKRGEGKEFGWCSLSDRLLGVYLGGQSFERGRWPSRSENDEQRCCCTQGGVKAHSEREKERDDLFFFSSPTPRDKYLLRECGDGAFDPLLLCSPGSRKESIVKREGKKTHTSALVKPTTIVPVLLLPSTLLAEESSSS